LSEEGLLAYGIILEARVSCGPPSQATTRTAHRVF